MVAYTPSWNRVIREMFGGSVGTSMDYPNLYRRVKNRPPGEYTALWTRNIYLARDAGIHLGVIAIPNKATLRVGAREFYSYFADDLEIDDFQVNTSFSGGEETEAKEESILDMSELSRFMVELAEVWAERGLERGVKLGPIDELLKRFMGEGGCLPCTWQQNCADEFVSIDARGYVAQYDCWVTSYPEYRFGNIFGDKSFTELIGQSRARKPFQARPEALMQRESYAGFEVYLSLFTYLDALAAKVSAVKHRRPSPLLPAFMVNHSSRGEFIGV
jgi:uncharacterized protein